MSNDEKNFSNGDLHIWTEAGGIHLKAVTKDGDPVELSAEEAREIARLLKAYADFVEL